MLLSTMYRLVSCVCKNCTPHTRFHSLSGWTRRSEYGSSLTPFVLFCRKMKHRPCFPYIQYQYDSTQKLEGIKILIVINICGPPGPDWAADGGVGGVAGRSLRHHRLLPGLHTDSGVALAVGRDVGGGAAVAVRGLRPLYV